MRSLLGDSWYSMGGGTTITVDGGGGGEFFVDAWYVLLFLWLFFLLGGVWGVGILGLLGLMGEVKSASMWKCGTCWQQVRRYLVSLHPTVSLVLTLISLMSVDYYYNFKEGNRALVGPQIVIAATPISQASAALPLLPETHIYIIYRDSKAGGSIRELRIHLDDIYLFFRFCSPRQIRKS